MYDIKPILFQLSNNMSSFEITIDGRTMSFVEDANAAFMIDLGNSKKPGPVSKLNKQPGGAQFPTGKKNHTAKKSANKT